MKYVKAVLTYDQQADLLLSRGLLADRDLLVSRLQAVNYYRLSGYLYPFRNSDDTYKPNTTLEGVWRRYTFDRRLRLLMMDGIERVEVAVRSQLAYHMAHAVGPFGYTIPANLPKLDGDKFGRFLSGIYGETQRSREDFVRHFQNKYGDQHGYLPIWMATEIMPFGSLMTLFSGVAPAVKRKVAGCYGIADEVLHSWLGTLNVIRNICAHHGRLWNRELGFRPKIPNQRKHPEWHLPVAVPDNRIFAVLTVLRHMLRVVAPQSAWQSRLRQLLDEYPDIPRISMGFPRNWEVCPIWRQA